MSKNNYKISAKNEEEKVFDNVRIQWAMGIYANTSESIEK